MPETRPRPATAADAEDVLPDSTPEIRSGLVPRLGSLAPESDTRVSHKHDATIIQGSAGLVKHGPNWQVEEFFRGIVEERSDEGVRVSVQSSGGEEGIAWIPWSEIALHEREYAIVGAPVRVSVLVPTVGKRQRTKRVRFLRPSQWGTRKRHREQTASFLLEQMKAVLNPDA